MSVNGQLFVYCDGCGLELPPKLFDSLMCDPESDIDTALQQALEELTEKGWTEDEWRPGAYKHFCPNCVIRGAVRREPS